MGGSLIINVLVYMPNDGLPVTYSIGLKPLFVIFLKIFLVVWQFTVPGFTHTVVRQKLNTDRVYTPMGGSKISMLCFAHIFGVELNSRSIPSHLLFAKYSEV